MAYYLTYPVYLACWPSFTRWISRKTSPNFPFHRAYTYIGFLKVLTTMQIAGISIV